MNLSIMSRKGGVGKTTTAVTLGHGLALRGYRVLVVDLDEQGHAGLMLTAQRSPGLRRWYYDGELAESVLVEARPGLWVLPGDGTTSRVVLDLQSQPMGAQRFGEALAELASGFDFALFDSAPSLNVLQIGGMLAADMVVIPAKLRFVDLAGIGDVLDALAEVSRYGGQRPYYVLPTFFDRTTKETPARLKELLGAVGKERVLEPIPQDVKLSVAPGVGKTAWEYAPQCVGLTGYRTESGYVGGYRSLVERAETWKEAIHG